MSRKFKDKLAKFLDGDESVAEGSATVGGVDIPMISMPEMSEEVLDAAEYAPGYTLETVLVSSRDDGESFKMQRVMANAGGYVGEPDMARLLIQERGILPELSAPGKNVCAVGFCPKEQKWYGWSHRAIFGFGIGDVVGEGDCCATSGWTDDYLAAHPEEDRRLPVGFKAETLDDARRMAVAFADAVG
jgi:hypothetical protein